MTVYIEYVLIDNLIIDYILLKSAFAILGRNENLRRLFLCSIISSIFALLCPLITINTIISTLIKVCFLLLVVVTCFKFNSWKEYLYFISLFSGLTFAVGGGIIGVFSLFNVDYSSEVFIALIFVPAYLILRLIKSVITTVYKRKTVTANSYKCNLTLNGVFVEVMGFIDTGNGVYDGDSPVVFLDINTAKKLLRSYPFPSVKKIDVLTAIGSKSLPSFKLHKVEIYFKDRPNIFNNVTACVCKSVGMGFGVIIHPDLKEGGKYEVDSSIKKIS